jgi:hypothetical protein
VGDLKGILGLARKHLKRPSIVLACDQVGELRISVAGQYAKVPGSLNVATNASYGQSVWYGRIKVDGSFEPSYRTATPATLLPLLRKFAARPAETAAEHGKLTGRCCFCDRRLTDERSTAVGYGGTCAKHYGLPWGERPVDQFGAADETEMQRLEAEGDREQTIREERAKHEAREALEHYPDPGELAEDRWNEVHGDRQFA